MRYLRGSRIEGKTEQVSTIRSLFVGVYFGGQVHITLKVAKVLPNFYRASNPEEMGAVLYVVVPSENIENVWPGRLGEIDEVRFGTATKGDQAITQAVAVHKGLATLYLCLSPNGVLIDDIGALGI